jgi:WD40 repeat protein
MNTFEITIQRRIDKEWLVVVKYQPDSGGMSLWTRGSFQLDLKEIIALSPVDKDYGLRLGKALFQESIFIEFQKALARSVSHGDFLRILLIVEAEDLLGLHWEQLQAPFDSGWDYLLLNQRTPYSRFLPTHIERRFPPIGRRDLRALLIVSGPDDLKDNYRLAEFDVNAVVERTRSAFGDIPCDVLANTEGAAGKPTLNELCKRITIQHYTLLHIICHGALLPDSGETVLYFPANDEGRPVKGSDLIRDVSRTNGAFGLPQFVFLSTCKSADPRAETMLGGFGQRLVRDLGMPAVLAMTDAISFKTADALAQPFYSQLFQHGEVDRALAEALAGLQDRRDVTVPALFSRLGNRALFSEIPERELTQEDIRYGLGELQEAIKTYSPVLLPEFEANQAVILATLELEADAVTFPQKQASEQALNVINQVSGEVLDMPFAALAFGKKAPVYDTRCPFQGLFPFHPKDREFFFGRELMIEVLVHRLHEHPFLAVLGPSGSGKSSVVLAGLVPAMGIPWTYLTPGADPVANLEAALQSGEGAELVVVDQFEELFTLVSDAQRQAAFIQRLIELIEPMRVIITMRADFLGECTHHPTLKTLIQTHQELIGPMDDHELRSAMEKQAEKVGLRFEADLSQDILDDVRGQPAAMPLLQHALLLLWERRHSLWLRSEEYRFFGGVQKAIAHTADEFFNNLIPTLQERVQDIFIRLTHLIESSLPGEIRDTRKREDLESLVPYGAERSETVRLINQLADKRLVVTSTNRATGHQEVEVAHEALITYWPLLRSWLEQDREKLRLRESVNTAAREWRPSGDDSLLVHRGGRLDDVIHLSRERKITLNQAEQDYIDACITLRDHEQKAREEQQQREMDAIRRGARRLRAALAVVVVVAAAAIFFWLDASRARDLARRQEEIAITERGYAEVQSTIADAERSAAKTQAAIADSERATAQKQSRLAISRQLASQAAAYRSTNPQLAMLLAVEAVRTTFTADGAVTLEADAILRELLSESFQPLMVAGQTSPVQFATMSPNGMYILTIEENGTAQIWDAVTGRQAVTIDSPSSVLAAAFNPPSTVLAVAGQDGSIVLYDAHTGTKLRLLGRHESVNSIVFSSSGQSLATASLDGKVRVWHLAGQSDFEELTGDGSIVRMMQFGPRAELLVFTSRGALILWKGEPGDADVRLDGGGVSPTGMAVVDPTWSKVLLVGETTTPQVWELPDLTSSRRLPALDGTVRAAAYTEVGLRFVLTGEDGTTTLWDGTNQVQLAVLLRRNFLQSGPHLAKFSPDGRYLVIAREEGRTLVWDAVTGRNIGELSYYSGNLKEVVFAASGMRLATIDALGQAWLWQPVREPDHLALDGLSRGVWRVVFDPTGRYIAAAGEEGVVQVWDAVSGGPVAQMVGHEILEGATAGINSLAFSPDGERLLTAGWDHTVRVWETRTGKELFKYTGHTGMVLDVLFDSSGTYAASAGSEGTVRVWDAGSGAEWAVWTTKGAVNRLALDPAGQKLAGSGSTTDSYLWDLQTKEQVELPAGTPLIGIQFSPDGKQVAGAGFDGHAYMWSALTGNRLHDLQIGSDEDLLALAYSPDGKLLATGGNEGVVKVWDTNSGKQILALRGHTSRIWSASFSPKGSRLATGSEDGTLRIWNLETGETEVILPGMVGEESFSITSLYDKTAPQSLEIGSDSINVQTTEEGLTIVSSSADLKLPWISWITYSPDGSRVVSAAMDGSVDLYITGIEELLQLAQQRAGREFSCRERVIFLNEDLICDPTQMPTEDSLPGQLAPPPQTLTPTP